MDRIWSIILSSHILINVYETIFHIYPFRKPQTIRPDECSYLFEITLSMGLSGSFRVRTPALLPNPMDLTDIRVVRFLVMKKMIENDNWKSISSRALRASFLPPESF